MSKLYPIGTQLITRRLSQAALYYEIFRGINIESFSSYEDRWGTRFVTHIGDDYVCKWRVTVTKENQKWLSPVPMVGDLMFPCETQWQKGEFAAMVEDPNFGYWHSAKRAIIQRSYPNGQRAPMLEWDEVIEPEVEGRK